MPELHASTYDHVPYPLKSQSPAHIRRLETLATLFEMKPVPITECRVLELGCAAGWNLIPQAYDFPESEFIGVDASADQIDEGQALADSLALDNVELRQTDLLDIDASWGKFDYILCHGVFSWVPQDVQRHIMRICKENLAPEGVAYVSYNVLPGWHFRGIARDMMLYHTEQFNKPEEQLLQARAVLKFMADNCPQDTTYAKVLSEEFEIVQDADDAYLYHDHLEEHNHPIYFHEFCRQAETEGLQYLGDIAFADMLQQHLPKPIQDALANASLVKQEQYMDFLRNNPFRKTLLCHASQPLNRQLHASDLEKFHLLLDCTTKPEPPAFSINATEQVRFSVGRRSIETSSPASKATLHELAASWPRALTLEELQQAVERRLKEAGVADQATGRQLREELAAGMMEMVASGMLDLFVHPPEVLPGDEGRPQVSELVRKQAEIGPNVTNPLHGNVRLDAGTRELVRQLDGSTSRKELAARVSTGLAEAGITPQAVDGEATVQIAPITTPLIDKALGSLTQSGLLAIE